MAKAKSEHRGARSYARQRRAPAKTPPVALLTAHYRLAFWALREAGFQLRGHDCRSWEDAWVEVRDWEHLEALINDTHFDFRWNPEPEQDWHPLARNLFRTAMKARRLEPAVVVSNIIQRDGLTAEAMEKAWREGLRLGAALGDLRHKVTDELGHPPSDDLGGPPPWLPDGTEHLELPLSPLASVGLAQGKGRFCQKELRLAAEAAERKVADRLNLRAEKAPYQAERVSHWIAAAIDDPQRWDELRGVGYPFSNGRPYPARKRTTIVKTILQGAPCQSV